jgi:hypothetical protein
MRGRMRLAHAQLVVVFLVLGSMASFLLGHEVGGLPEARTAQTPGQPVVSAPSSVGTVPASGGLSNRSFAPKHTHHTPTHSGTKPPPPSDDQGGSTSVTTVDVLGSGTVTVTITYSTDVSMDHLSPVGLAKAPRFASTSRPITSFPSLLPPPLGSVG